ncbi:MAG: hypothetical protein KDC66_16545 [Phaeodactylibacter sp.]|nr:hypothetical protein [Phaeodactylibacter sp.]MCB9275395.1 hypothetical protein [Lewinellaceae bacterium]
MACRVLAPLCLLFFSVLALNAQKGLSGLWEGKITFGGIYSEESYRFELYLQAKDGRIKGQSYIYVSEDSIITRQLSGRMYEDRSIYLEEVDPSLFPASGEWLPGDTPAFNRKYQVLFDRSIWDTKLEGFWQEVTPHTFHYKRQRGRVLLRKKTQNAKA